MTAVWLLVAVLCVVAGVVLLVLDRRRRAGPPELSPDAESLPDAEPQPEAEPQPGVEPRADGDDAPDLFTPNALPRDPH